MPGILIDNPIAWAHFKVRGGWRNHLWSFGGYTLLITAAIIITSRLSQVGPIFNGWTGGLLGLQLAILLFFGCATVGNGIRRDITSGLLESHRLMPVSSAAAVFGYLTGPTFQALTLVAANFILGTVTANLGGVPMEKWLMANVIIAFFVTFIWVAIAFASFVAKNAFALIVGLLVPGMMSGGQFLEIIPALCVLATPVSGNSIFIVIARGRPFTLGLGWALTAQCLFGAIFFRGAMRRYRRDDVPALGILLGLLLLAAWAGTSALGIVRAEDFRPAWMAGREDPFALTSRVIAALLTSMLIGIAPVAASAQVWAEWMRAHRMAGRESISRPLPPPLIACIATLIVLPIVFTVPIELRERGTLISVALILAAFFLSITYLLRIFYRRGKKAAFIIAAWIVVTWLIPLGLDALRQNTLGLDMPFASLFSPWGALINLWSDHPVRNVIGLGAQVLMAVALAGLFYATEPKRRPQPTALPVQ